GSVLVQGSAGLALLLAIGGWLVLWPRQRLANCALLLDDQAPAAAVQAARRLVRTRGRAVYGLWTTQLLLNLGLLLVSALLAGLAAGLMAGLWALLGADTAPSPPIAILVAGAVLLIGLLCWDGVVSAFTLSTWAVAYGELQRDPDAPLTPVGTTQLLGRQE
ncbi:MAG TPA: hypothetical protein VM536_20630, partial [Chloroflexia bacterium]|nr:hypothetical protein [Chloroflexia bacterium]